MARFITKSENQRRAKKWYIKDTQLETKRTSIATAYMEDE